MKRVLSGIQPTGSIHIGNLGTIRHSVAMQAEFENILCIVDLHAISIPQEPETLKAKIREVAALLLASGIDLNNRQSLFSRKSTPRNIRLGAR